MNYQLLWFKKDLRVDDHMPMLRAVEAGLVLPVYVIEPEILESEEFDSSHQVFINECLAELHRDLVQRGSGLLVFVGRLPDVFEQIKQKVQFEKIWCHEETGNFTTFKRDLRVIKWCKDNGVEYEEIPQTGVVRRLRTRDGWRDNWLKRMGAPLVVPPERFNPADLQSFDEFGLIPSLEQLRLPPSTKPGAQLGGEALAKETLESFLNERSVFYRTEMSSPVTGEESCSRLSPYLTFGSISLKATYQRCQMRKQELKETGARREWGLSLDSFAERLIWHCHFMQKLENEPEMEFRNLSRAYDGLREEEFREDYFQAWCEGRTGFPMIDACMRALHHCGWINFRMRAMLVSFASNQLWLHWRPTAVYLAKHFLDFEPGIHYAQFQMQSATSGINSVRVYNPVKQAKDQDPNGDFIRRFVPELRDLPAPFIFQPELTPPLFQQFHHCIIGEDYPFPIVDNDATTRLAKDRIYSLRMTPFSDQEFHRVFKKHGSRISPSNKNWR